MTRKPGRPPGIPNPNGGRPSKPAVKRHAIRLSDELWQVFKTLSPSGPKWLAERLTEIKEQRENEI